MSRQIVLDTETTDLDGDVIHRGVRVLPGHHEHGEALLGQVLHHAVLRLEVEDVELVDPGRHDQERPLEHGVRGRGVLDQLHQVVAEDDLARRHGLHATAPLSFRMSDPADIAATMDRLRVTGIGRLTGARVVETTDLAHGSATLPPTDGLILRTDADDRVIIRPSGTEPKLKCYLEVVAPCTGDVVPHAAARDRLDELRRDVSAAVCGTIEG